MAIRDLALLGLIVFSGQISSATRLGPNRHWARQFLLPNATTGSEKGVSADSTIPESLPPVGEARGGATGQDVPTGVAEKSGDDRIPDDDEDGELMFIPGDPDDPNDVGKVIRIPPTPDDDDDGKDEPTKIGGVTREIPTTTGPLSTAATGYSTGNETSSQGWNRTDTSSPYNNSTTTSHNGIYTVPDPIYSFPNGETCTSLGPGEITTVFSIIYTETVTWTGDPTDYTPPFPDETITTPTYCKTAAAGEQALPSAMLSLPPNMDGYTTTCETEGTQTVCKTEIAFHPSFILSLITNSPSREKGMHTTGVNVPKVGEGAAITSTFFMTPKNPTVVFPSSDKPPGYGKSDPADPANTHVPAGNGNTPPPYQQSMKIPDTNNKNNDGGGGSGQYTVTADPTMVVINEKTITSMPPAATTRVTVDGGVFEINPSQIIQLGGATVDRPAPGGGLYVPDATRTNVGGLDVQVTGTAAIIDGYTYTIGLTPRTEIVQGQTVVIGPTGINFISSKQTISFKAVSPEQTEVVVAGGELVTAVGQSVVVIHSTTFTYGPGISPRTEVVDDDTVVIGPSGVVVHGTTIGGEKLAGTKYEIVGGATITQIGPSKVAIGGKTYTVGPGSGKTTTEVGGETITIGPDGVVVSTLTLHYPFGPTIVTTLLPSATATAPSPAQTGDDEDDAGTFSRPSWSLGSIGLCIAIGAWGLGFTI